MDGMIAINFVNVAAKMIYERLDDSIDQLKTKGNVTVYTPKGIKSQAVKTRIWFDSTQCNNFKGYARDFTVDDIQLCLMKVLQDSGILNTEKGFETVLRGNSLLAAADLLARFVQQYVKTFSTRTPNDGAQKTLCFLSKYPEQDDSQTEAIRMALSGDVSLDYDFTSVPKGDIITKRVVQSLLGNISKELNRHKRFFMRYDITYDTVQK